MKYKAEKKSETKNSKNVCGCKLKNWGIHRNKYIVLCEYIIREITHTTMKIYKKRECLPSTLSLPARSIIIFYKVAVEHDKNDYRDWNIDFDVIQNICLVCFIRIYVVLVGCWK